jgi:hypothetical protein
LENTFIEYLLMDCHANGARNISVGDDRPVDRGDAAVDGNPGARRRKAGKFSRERGYLSIVARATGKRQVL